MASRRLAEAHVLVTALADGQEEGDLQGTDDEPTGDGHPDGQRARHRAEHEAEGDGEDVGDDDVLEPRGVGSEEDHVGQRGEREGGRDQPRRAEPHRDKGHGDGHGEPGRKGAGGNGPRPLQGVEAVALAVGHVVEQVDGAGQSAEHGEGGEGDPRRGREQLL